MVIFLFPKLFNFFGFKLNDFEGKKYVNRLFFFELKGSLTMASEDLKSQVPVEENGTKEEEKNGNLEASVSKENGESSDVFSVIQEEEGEEEEGETKGDCLLLLDYA